MSTRAVHSHDMKVILSASMAHGYSVVRCQPAQCLVTSIDKNNVSLCCGIHKHSVLSRAVKSLLSSQLAQCLVIILYHNYCQQVPPFPRTTIDWNNLEQEIVSSIFSKALESFKTQISRCP